MQIQLPPSIKVGGLDFTIEHSPEIDRELRCNGNWGEHNSWLQRIRIRQEGTPQGVSQTILHEIIHAVDYVYLTNKLSEDYVEQLSQGLTQVFEQLDIRLVLKEG